MNTKNMSVTSLILLLLALISPLTSARANSLDVRIRLVGSPEFSSSKGSAKYRDRSGEREFQVEAEVPRRFAGAVYSVSINGSAIGTMTISPLGAGRISLNSRRGQTVPVVVPGTQVRVATQAGVTVVSGTF